MNMRIKTTFILAVLLLAAGCRERKAEQFHALPFPDVQLPSMISGQQEALYEVRRILKAFIDAQWLNEFDQRLTEYAAQFQDASPES